MWLLCRGLVDASPLPSSDLPSYGALLIKTVIALVVVVALAWAFLRWGLRRLLPGRPHSDEMEVVDRLPLESRRSIVLVRVHGRYLLLGSAEGSVTLLAELEPEQVARLELLRAERPRRSFAEVLREAVAKRRVEPETIPPRARPKDRPTASGGCEVAGSGRGPGDSENEAHE